MLQKLQNVSISCEDVAKVAKNKNIFYCKNCDYSTSRKSSWLKHIETKKHKRTMFQKLQDNENYKKKDGNYFCEWCDYTTYKKCNFIKHRNTKKCLLQKKKQLAKKCSKILKDSIKISTFTCEWCEKSWGSRQSLWRHKKKCKSKKISEDHNPNIDCFDKDEKITIDINEYNKLKKKAEGKVVEESKPQTVIHNITNNINYNCFNVFLDEHCKGAQTLKDFVNSINVSLKDLDYTKKNGYVEGISSILNKQLEDLNPTDRPIHSTDQKRLKFMVKNKDGWVKDDGSQLNKVVIRETKFKLVKSLSDWEKENPGYGSNPQKLQVWQESLNKIAPPEDVKEKYDKAIIKNLAKEASIKDAIKSLTD